MAAKHSTKPATIPAVAYLRMSSSKQEESPDQQRTEITKLAEQHGYRIVQEYFDDGISGDATEKRLQFQQMIADAGKGDFKAILCWDVDRFGRFNSIEAGHWIYPLVQAGVKLVTVGQGIIDWTDFAGRIVYSVQQEGKHALLRDLSRNSMRGKLAAAMRGEWLGRVPCGYRLKHGGERSDGRLTAARLVLGPADEVQLVRDVFAWYLAGESIRGIARRLSRENRPRTSVVEAILKRVAYTGTFKWNAKPRGKYASIRGGKVGDAKNGDVNADDWIIIPKNHPAIIDQQTFDAVQQRLTERKQRTTPHVNGGKFVLSGLIRCGKCGAAMVGKCDSSRPVNYICGANHRDGVCDRNTVRQDQLLGILVDTIVERFTNPVAIKQMRDELRKQVKATTSKVTPKAVGKQLATVEAKLAKAKRRLVEVEADMIPVVSDQIREFTGKRDELKVALKAAQIPTKTRLAEADASVDYAMELFSRLRETLDGTDTVQLRELLSRIVDRVDVWSRPEKCGSRRKFKLDHGSVHLRGDQLPHLSTSS